MESAAKKANEEKKEYLRGYRKALARAKRLEEQINELREAEISPKVRLSGMPGGSGDNADISDYVVKMDELISSMIREKNNAIEVYKEIWDAIEQLKSEKEKKVLVCRYLMDYKWKEVEKAVGFEWAQVHRIHASALKNFSIPEK